MKKSEIFFKFCYFVIELLTIIQITSPVVTAESLLSLGANSEQSTVYSGNGPAFGNDGNLNTMFHTDKSSNNFWKVDLGRVFHLTRVYLINRKDGFGDRIKNVRITVGTTLDNLKECAFFAGPSHTGHEINLKCDAVGRHVYLKQEANNFFHLLEVQVYGNEINGETLLSKKKPTSQKSVYGNQGSSYGNDHDVNTIFHTNRDINNYWTVDLGQVYSIKRIYLINRKDGKGERLRNLQINVGKTMNTLNLCAYYDGPSHTRHEFELLCNRIGRFVHLVQEVNDFFHLAEVQVFGSTHHDDLLLSQGQKSEQSSTYGTLVAAKGNDGDLNTMFHTNGGTNNFWRVDLGDVFKITRLFLVNRKDNSGERLRNLKVSVGNDLNSLTGCAYYQGPSRTGDEIELACGAVGRLVQLVQETNDFFHLNEVQVFGNPFRFDVLLSEGKTSAQSSSYGPDYVASKGNDGNLNTMFHTLKALNNFWRVDLGQTAKVTRLYLINRKDHNGERVSNLRVSVGNELNNLKECAYYKGPSFTNDEIELVCTAVGRHVYIKQEANNFFHLLEVKVYGTPFAIDVLLSEGKTSHQSSSYSVAYAASKGNDGNLKTMFHTKKAANNFWTVDLGTDAKISYLKIINRKDGSGHRLRNLRISVGKDLNSLHECAYYSGPSKTGDEFQIQCDALGRHVYLKQEVDDYFHLVEVQVYGNEFHAAVNNFV